MENIVDPKSRRINGAVYGSQEPLNITPKGSVDRNGGGAVASMGGPGRYCANAANVTSDNDTAAVTGSSNFDVSNVQCYLDDPLYLSVCGEKAAAPLISERCNDRARSMLRKSGIRNLVALASD
eukprot:scaffold23809_cov62-Cyclotella_meneghiniana.AAC.15